jgi:hypothetical protein
LERCQTRRDERHRPLWRQREIFVVYGIPINITFKPSLYFKLKAKAEDDPVTIALDTATDLINGIKEQMR